MAAGHGHSLRRTAPRTDGRAGTAPDTAVRTPGDASAPPSTRPSDPAAAGRTAAAGRGRTDTAADRRPRAERRGGLRGCPGTWPHPGRPQGTVRQLPQQYHWVSTHGRGMPCRTPTMLTCLGRRPCSAVAASRTPRSAACRTSGRVRGACRLDHYLSAHGEGEVVARTPVRGRPTADIDISLARSAAQRPSGRKCRKQRTVNPLMGPARYNFLYSSSSRPSAGPAAALRAAGPLPRRARPQPAPGSSS
jgi:hypothetical protein